ncbi:MAG: hypothetical protein PUK76_03970 [Treponema sp.]|nr:hypothetical protein [Treponema sp.]MDY2924433.1 hypothetical protein [Treponema sp.]
MINTLNESSLHRALKTIYSLDNNSKTEEQVSQWICDIVQNENVIIEIQTANVSSLKNKIKCLLKMGKTVKIVHPVVISKTIKTSDIYGTIISTRKSPKKESIYSIFRQLTGITEFLLHENFILEIPQISIIEHRLKTSQAQQSKNKKRRFLKDWQKTDKELKEIFTISTFSKKEDYLNLLPQYKEQNKELCNNFTAKQTASLLKQKINAAAATNTHCMLWVLKKAGMIQETLKIKNEKHYKISE